MSRKEHSVKVPRLYKVAAGILKAHKNGEGSLKSLVFNARSKHPNVKALMALVSQCLDKKEVLSKAFDDLNLIKKEPKLDVCLAEILVMELWNKKQLPGHSKPVETIQKYSDQLMDILSSSGNTGSKKRKNVNNSSYPRYVRVNTLKSTFVNALLKLKAEGYVQVMYKHGTSYEEYLDKVKSLSEKEYLLDLHIDDLLVFAPGTEFHGSKLYKEGVLLLQDKASCMPVQALGIPSGSKALDGCAAPGMKTSQIAAQVYKGAKSNGSLIAIERDGRRCKILRKMLKTAGALDKKSTLVQNQDFLKIDPISKGYKDVEYIVLDPSCSGSGMPQQSSDQDLSQERLEKLSNLQITLVQHAMSFPNLKRLSYSTCSVEDIENEQVVSAALQSRQGGNFELIEALPSWPRRGKEQFGDLGAKCVRALPKEDLCTGFFVAVFQRK